VRTALRGNVWQRIRAVRVMFSGGCYMAAVRVLLLKGVPEGRGLPCFAALQRVNALRKSYLVHALRSPLVHS
jgi:hypothetical protein